MYPSGRDDIIDRVSIKFGEVMVKGPVEHFVEQRSVEQPIVKAPEPQVPVPDTIDAFGPEHFEEEDDEFHEAKGFGPIAEEKMDAWFAKQTEETKTNPKKLPQERRDEAKLLWEKRVKQIDAKQIKSWSADLGKLAKTEPDVQAAMQDKKFEKQYQKLIAEVQKGTYSNMKLALESGKFEKVKALLGSPVYTDYIRESTLLSWKAVGGKGRLKEGGAAAPVSPDVSIEHPEGPWVKDSKNIEGGGWVTEAALKKAADAQDLQLGRSDPKTQGLLEASKALRDSSLDIAAKINRGEIGGNLFIRELSETNKLLLKALGGDENAEKAVRQAQRLRVARVDLSESQTHLKEQVQRIDEQCESLRGTFDVLNAERREQMKEVSGEPPAYLEALSSQVKSALGTSSRPENLGLDLSRLIAQQEVLTPEAKDAVVRVSQFRAGLKDGSKLVTYSSSVAQEKEERLARYITDLRVLLKDPGVSPDVQEKLQKELTASETALESLKKFNDLALISEKETSIKASLDKLEEEKKSVADTFGKLQRAAHLTERMEQVVKVKSLTERKRALVFDRSKLKAELTELERVGDNDALVNPKTVGFKVSANPADRQQRMMEVRELVSQTDAKIKAVNDLFNGALAKIKTFDADPTKELPEASWGQKIWDVIVKGTVIPAGERLGREDVSDLVREKLMADKGITLQESYVALGEKLKGAKTVSGALELIQSLQKLPEWAYKNPQIAKELAGDIAHAISILQQGPEAGRYKGTLDSIVTRVQAEGLASDLLVGNRTEYEDREVPAEVFALMHMAKMAPYVARAAKPGETTLGNMLRGIGGEGLIGGVLGKLGDLGQGIVTTSIEKNVARSLPTGTDALITAAQQLYRGDGYQDVAKRYAAREAAKAIAGNAREIYEEGFGTWAKNLISFKQLRDTWKNSGTGEKIYRVLTEAVLPVGGALALGFLLGGPVGIAVALAVSLGGTFLAGRFNDRVTPFVTSTQENIRKQRMAERAKKFLLTDKQYQDSVAAAAGNTGMKPDRLHEQSGEYLAEKLQNIAKDNGGTLKNIGTEKIKQELEAAIAADNKTDAADRAQLYVKDKRAKGQALRDGELQEMQNAIGQLETALFAPHEIPGSTEKKEQPEWTEATKAAVLGDATSVQ